MTTDDNKRLVSRYLERVWNQSNPEAAREFLDPSFKRYTSATTEPLDAAGQIDRLKGFRRAFPNASVRLDELIAENDLVVFRSTMTGTHEGDFAGVSRTSRSVTVQLLDMVRVRDGKFVEHWGGPDMADLLRQLQE